MITPSRGITKVRQVLLDHYCAQWPRGVQVEIDGVPEDWILPSQFVLTGELIDASGSDASATVKALLDTGCDITTIRREVVHRLAKINGGVMPNVERRILTDQGAHPLPSFDLSFVFPVQPHSDDPPIALSSRYGFIMSTEDDRFLDEDMWLGQDIFNQLIIGFNGLTGTVTIAIPDTIVHRRSD